MAIMGRTQGVEDKENNEERGEADHCGRGELSNSRTSIDGL